MTNNKKRKFDHDSGAELFNQKNWRPTEEPRVDPTYGQRSAIPGLDSVAYGEDEESLSYDDDMDALSYLRAVRLVHLLSIRNTSGKRCVLKLLHRAMLTLPGI